MGRSQGFRIETDCPYRNTCPAASIAIRTSRKRRSRLHSDTLSTARKTATRLHRRGGWGSMAARNISRFSRTSGGTRLWPRTGSTRSRTSFRRNIAKLFFFDGEQVESYAAQDNSTQLIGGAIQNLLGLDIVDRLEKDLRTYLRRKRDGRQGRPAARRDRESRGRIKGPTDTDCRSEAGMGCTEDNRYRPGAQKSSQRSRTSTGSWAANSTSNGLRLNGTRPRRRAFLRKGPAGCGVCRRRSAFIAGSAIC